SIEYCLRREINTWSLALARTSDIQYPSSPISQPPPQFRHRLFIKRRIQLNDTHWLTAPLRDSPGFQAAAFQFTQVEDQRCVAIAHIANRARTVTLALSLDELVLGVQRSVFRPPALRAPATVGNATRDGPIQRRTIGASLTTRDNS